MSFGSPEIDEERKHFVDLLNGFNDTVANRMGTNAVVRALSDILDFVDCHFPDEEKLSKDVGYPDADDHSQKHTQLRTLLGKTIGHARNDAADYLLIEAGLNIKEQMIDHLLNEDLKYAEYCRNSRTSPGAVDGT
ncbi:MAG: hemerythrin domain-containing protein [Gallionella sp.]